MAYQVVLADSAKADANAVYDWVVERAPIRGQEWFDELIDCLYSLEAMPSRCPLAREAKEAKREIAVCILESASTSTAFSMRSMSLAGRSGFYTSDMERFRTSRRTC